MIATIVVKSASRKDNHSLIPSLLLLCLLFHISHLRNKELVIIFKRSNVMSETSLTHLQDGTGTIDSMFLEDYNNCNINTTIYSCPKYFGRPSCHLCMYSSFIYQASKK